MTRYVYIVKDHNDDVIEYFGTMKKAVKLMVRRLQLNDDAKVDVGTISKVSAFIHVHYPLTDDFYTYSVYRQVVY